MISASSSQSRPVPHGSSLHYEYVAQFGQHDGPIVRSRRVAVAETPMIGRGMNMNLYESVADDR